MLSARPEGPTLEARRAESRGGVLGNFGFGAFWDLKIASKQCKMMVFVN